MDSHAVTPQERRELRDAAARVEAQLRDEAAIAEGTDQEKLLAFARWIERVKVPAMAMSNAAELINAQIKSLAEFARFAAR